MRLFPPLFDDPRSTKTYDDAHKFMKEASATGSTNYEWVWDYAKDLWSYRECAYRTLDEKADSIIKYLGGGTGLFAIGVLSKIDAKNAHIAAWTMLPIAFGILAVLLAVCARIPTSAPDPATIKVAKEIYAEGRATKEEAMAAFLGQWHALCEGMALVNDKKSSIVAWATWLYWIAITLLLVPLCVAILYPPI